MPDAVDAEQAAGPSKAFGQNMQGFFRKHAELLLEICGTFVAHAPEVSGKGQSTLQKNEIFLDTACRSALDLLHKYKKKDD